MKVGVCFKIVPDYEEIQMDEWEKPQELDFTYVKKMYGCFDEAALETGLRVKDSLKKAGVEAEAVAVTAGEISGSVSEGLVRGCLAAGFDDVVILPSGDDFSPVKAAGNIGAYFKENPADLIFTGRMVGPYDSGTFPYYLAEELGCDLIAEAVRAEYSEDDKSFHVSCKEDKHIKTYSVSGKAVCTVGDSENPYLRLFPLKARMEAKKKDLITWEKCENNLISEPYLRCEKAEEKDCIMIEEKTAEEIAALLAEYINGEAK